MDDVLREFLDEAGAHLRAAAGEVARLRQAPDEGARLALFRRLHSLKGTAGFLPLPRIAALAHAAEAGLGGCCDEGGIAAMAAALGRMETLLRDIAHQGAEPDGDDPDVTGPLAAAALQARTRGLDAPSPAEEAELADLVALVAEMAEARRRLAGAMQRAGSAPARRILDVAGEMEVEARAAHAEPIGRAFTRLPRLADRLKVALGKSFDLAITGDEVLVAARVLAAVRDAVPHLIRNAADHGLEPEAARIAAGKPGPGRITVAARKLGETVTVSVRDDGAGLDVEAIRRAAGRDVSPLEATRLVLRPGLTTAGRVTAVSGRGIGLDAVRAVVEAAGGMVEISFEAGRGTTCTLTLPRCSSHAPASPPAPPRAALLSRA